MAREVVDGVRGMVVGVVELALEDMLLLLLALQVLVEQGGVEDVRARKRAWARAHVRRMRGLGRIVRGVAGVVRGIAVGHSDGWRCGGDARGGEVGADGRGPVNRRQLVHVSTRRGGGGGGTRRAGNGATGVRRGRG